MKYIFITSAPLREHPHNLIAGYTYFCCCCCFVSLFEFLPSFRYCRWKTDNCFLLFSLSLTHFVHCTTAVILLFCLFLLLFFANFFFWPFGTILCHSISIYRMAVASLLFLFRLVYLLVKFVIFH